MTFFQNGLYRPGLAYPAEVDGIQKEDSGYDGGTQEPPDRAGEQEEKKNSRQQTNDIKAFHTPKKQPVAE